MASELKSFLSQHMETQSSELDDKKNKSDGGRPGSPIDSASSTDSDFIFKLVGNKSNSVVK